tara:strand:+ start:9464 stop:10810 length:1347 start_codon:yes stop_codon:yes gene_type:complete
MALPILETQKDEGQILQIVSELGTAIFKSAKLSLDGAAKAVIPSIPDMVDEVLEDLKSGSVRTFNLALDKLDNIVQKLGIDLGKYNKELANFQENRQEKLIKSEDKLQILREQNIIATIEKSGEVKILSKKEIEVRQKNLRTIEKDIIKEQKLLEKDRTLLQESNKLKTDSVETTRLEIESRTQYIKDLHIQKQDETEVLQQRSEEKPGLLQRGREATGNFVDEYVPTPIAEVGQMFVQGLTAPLDAMKDLSTTFGGLLKPLKLLKPLFMGVVKGLKKFMMGLMASLIAFLPYIAIGALVIAAVLGIVAIFKKLKAYIQDSWLGRKLFPDEEAKKQKLLKKEERKAEIEKGGDDGIGIDIEDHYNQTSKPKIIPYNESKWNKFLNKKPAEPIKAKDLSSIDKVNKSGEGNTLVNAPSATNIQNNSTFASGLGEVRNTDYPFMKTIHNT